MPWTEITRREYARTGRRYASDTTDEEWALIAPFMPPPKATGRPAHDRVARCGRCPLVQGLDGLSVGDDPQGLSAALDGATLFL